MTSRQKKMPMSQMMVAIEASATPSCAALARAMVTVACSRPAYTAAETRQNAIDRVCDEVETACYQTFAAK